MTRLLRRGFTLVELLVVIAIIGVLIGLLLPAVQKVRESANRSRCINNIKQMALGCLEHESKYRRLPGDGSFYKESALADKGIGAKQPGGWHYQILPFIEQDALHGLGTGGNSAQLRAAGKQRVETMVSLFVCPSRGPALPIPYTLASTPYKFTNIDTPDHFFRSDYAGNGGNHRTGWTTYMSTDQTGVIYSAEGLRLDMIKDGLANTYLLGERFLNPDYYNRPGHNGNDQGWTTGHDFDTFRGTDWKAADPVTSSTYSPRRDRAGVNIRESFGSPHSVFHMGFCDGGVRAMSYSLAPENHFRHGHRADGQTISE